MSIYARRWAAAPLAGIALSWEAMSVQEIRIGVFRKEQGLRDRNDGDSCLDYLISRQVTRPWQTEIVNSR